MNRDERMLAARLAQVNQEIGRYVLRVLDESDGSGTTEYTRPIRDVEHALGTQLLALGRTLQACARERGLVVLEDTDVATEPEAPHQK